jgi:AraC-like DNA-binding protein
LGLDMTLEWIPSPVRRVVTIEYADHARYGRVPIHSATHCKLDLVLDGEVRMIRDDYTVQSIHAGTAVLIPPLTPHGYEPRGRMCHLVIKANLHPRYQFLLARHVNVMNIPAHLVPLAHEIGQAYQTRHALGRQVAETGAVFLITHALRRIIARHAARHAEMHYDERLILVVNRVMDNPLGAWTVKGLAEQSHLSESHFNKCFREAFGQAPQQFLVDMRIIAAADLIRGSDQSIKTIAEKADYASVHSFTRAFTRVIGQSPGVFRRVL